MRRSRLAWHGSRRRPTRPDGEEIERGRLEATPDAALARGPGLVAAAFGIDRQSTGLDLLDPASPLRVEAPLTGGPTPSVAATPRIGIGYAGPPWTEKPWRFLDPTSPSISGPRRP